MQTDIIPLVDQSYPSSFGNISTNKKALAVRGWDPFNWILFLHDTVCTTTTSSQLEQEQSFRIFSFECFKNLTPAHQNIQSSNMILANKEGVQVTLSQSGLKQGTYYLHSCNNYDSC